MAVELQFPAAVHRKSPARLSGFPRRDARDRLRKVKSAPRNVDELPSAFPSQSDRAGQQGPPSVVRCVTSGAKSCDAAGQAVSLQLDSRPRRAIFFPLIFRGVKA